VAASCCEALRRRRRLTWPGAVACAGPEQWSLPPAGTGRASCGLGRGLRSDLQDGVLSLGRRNAMAFCFSFHLLHDFSGLTLFLLRASVSHVEVSKFNRAAFLWSLRSCVARGGGQLGGSESCSEACVAVCEKGFPVASVWSDVACRASLFLLLFLSFHRRLRKCFPDFSFPFKLSAF
jgi:hypothetical protein